MAGMLSPADDDQTDDYRSVLGRDGAYTGAL